MLVTAMKPEGQEQVLRPLPVTVQVPPPHGLMGPQAEGPGEDMGREGGQEELPSPILQALQNPQMAHTVCVTQAEQFSVLRGRGLEGAQGEWEAKERSKWGLREANPVEGSPP